MNVFLTGAFGNLGSLVTEALLQRGHQVFAFDVNTKGNRKIAKSFSHYPNLSICWGDIRDQQQVAALVAKVEVVIHLAAVIAPFSEANPKLAYEVNVLGTEYIIDAISNLPKPPLLIFSSSISTFGPKDKQARPSTLHDKLVPTDHYSEHKIQCEQRVQQLASTWAILRLAAMVDSRMRHGNLQQARLAFSIAADNKVEYIHPKDACTAIVNILDRPESHNRIHLIGGGVECQTTHLGLMQSMMDPIGIELTTDEFGTAPLYAHWVDTTDSQRLLDFQHHTLADLRRENERKFRFIRPLVKTLNPIIKISMKHYLRA